MKFRLALNTALSGRSNWTIFFTLLFGFFWFGAMWSGAFDFLRFLAAFAKGKGLFFLFSLVLGYFVLLLFVSDLFLGHSLNIGQVSTDFNYLSSLPLSPSAILLVKLFERMITNWIGIFMLYGCFLGVSTWKALAVTPILISTILYVELEFLMGLYTTLIYTFLQRFLRPAALSNTLSLVAYLSAFLGFIPFVWLSGNPEATFFWILGFQNKLQNLEFVLTPLAWICKSLLLGPGPEFAFWHLFWVLSMVLGWTCFLLMAREKWIAFVHPGLKARAEASKSWLTGLYRKEAILLKSDFNLLTNALFLPLTLIVFEIWILRGLITLSSPVVIRYALGIAALYFCMFGPMNAIGSEKRAIAILETLPIRPSEILLKKTLFWILLAEVFFIPAAIGAMWYLGFSFVDQVSISVWLFFLIMGYVWVSISLSAIFPNFEAKVLQKSSDMEGKFCACMAMTIALPAQSLEWHGILSGLAFFFLAAALFRKACEALRHRLDPDFFVTPDLKVLDGLIIVFSGLGLFSFIRSNQVYLSHWGTSWFWAYFPFLFFLALNTWLYARKRFPRWPAAVGLRAFSAKWAAGALFASAFFGSLWSLAFDRFTAMQTSLIMASPELLSFPPDFGNFSWFHWFLLFVFVFLAPVIEELFFRGFLLQGARSGGMGLKGGLLLSTILASIVNPGMVFIPAFSRHLCCGLFFHFSNSAWPGIIFQICHNSVFAWLFFYHLPRMH